MLSALEMFGDFHIFVKKMVVVSFFIFQAKWRFKGKIFLAILFYNCFSWGVTAHLFMKDACIGVGDYHYTAYKNGVSQRIHIWK